MQAVVLLVALPAAILSAVVLPVLLVVLPAAAQPAKVLLVLLLTPLLVMLLAGC